MAPHSVVCLVLLILVTVAPCCSHSPAVIETPNLSAFVWTCVEIKCKVTEDLPDEDALWYWMKVGTWDTSINDYSGTIVYSNKPERLPISPQFIGRVTYTGSTRLANTASSSNNPSCSVLICDLKQDDTGTYFFGYNPQNLKYKWKTVPDASLIVTEFLNKGINPCEITFNKPAAVQEGHTVTLSCSTPTTCRSYLEIDSVPPTGLTTSQFLTSYTAYAEFRASWTDDDREFVCQTRGNTDPQLVKKIRISVEYEPRNTNIEIVGLTTDVAAGQSVILKCITDANPPPGAYHWYKKYKHHQKISENRLELKNVQRADEGCYSCRATNRIRSGDHSKELCINVLYGPEEVRVQADPGLMVKENMTLTLRCSAQSDPPVSSFSWSRVTAGQERRVHTGTVYTVKSVSVNDTGLYSCTAHHPIRNKTSAPAQVQVQFGPKQVVVLRAEEEQGPDGSSSVTLSCSSHSFPLSLYTWYRSTEGRATKVSENINYTVPSTQPGLYYCTAKNNVSESTSEPVSLFQQQEDYVKYILPSFKVVLIVLLPIFIYRMVRDLQELQTEESTSNNCLVGGRNRRKQTQRQGLNQEPSFFEETVVYENINVGQKETCPQLTDRREEQVNIDVCRAQVTFSATAPEEEEEEVEGEQKRLQQ